MKRNKKVKVPKSSTTQEVNYEPKPKRERRQPDRFKISYYEDEEKSTRSLSEELKSWTDISLSVWSEILQWKSDLSIADIATAVKRDECSVERLNSIIMENEWNDIVLSNGVGSGILVNKEDNEMISTEKPLDSWIRNRCPPWKVQFWHQLSAMLTPDELNNSSQLSSIMQRIAENSPAEYAPIYEYLAIIMDDPASTVHMNVNLTGLQAGILLEILHGIAMSVKDTSNIQALLRKRAVATVKGDWETLKMPVRGDKDEPMTSNLKKRVSLQCLNPFGMPKDTLPPVPVELPTPNNQKRLNISSAVPMPISLRSTSEMNQINKGFKRLDVVYEIPRIDVDK